MSSPSAPPPNYGSAYPQPGYTGYAQASPQEPPPKYEPPKQAEYQQPQPGTQYPSGVHTTTTVIVRSNNYGAHPITVDCPNCRASVSTQTQYTTGTITWLSAGLICLFGCWMGCCLIPFCINDLQDVEHRCPNCGVHLGTYSRI